MKKRPKKESLLLPKLLQKIAPRIGARVYIEPEWGVVGQITFKNGRRSYFRYNTLDLNPVGASDIAKDKAYAAHFLRHLGYPVPEGEVFFRRDFAETIGSKRGVDAAARYARRIGFPLFVKPNSGSQGRSVRKVGSERELRRAIADVFRHDRIALVQRPLAGRDYRVVVLDGEIISAYERLPLNVTSDGRASIARLLARKQREFAAAGRDTLIKRDDPRIASNVRRAGLSMQSVLPQGQQLQLLDNANLSSGGDARDVTRSVHPAFKTLAAHVTRDMGLRLCGVDLIVDGDISEKPARWWVLEINAAPGLDHYASVGRAQERIVEALYTKVLRALAR
jgi:D-alanine-D-alanine ligase-like ATP-grasp enzyme